MHEQPCPVPAGMHGEERHANGERALLEIIEGISFAGALQVRGKPAGAFTFAGSATTDERVGLVHDVAAAHGRTPELDVLLQQVVLT